MRTKTLLLTAALGAAGIATSMAQVYSQNAVGYINLALPAGFTMIANQLVQPGGDYKLSALIPAPPLGTFIYKYNGSGFDAREFNEFSGVWEPDANLTIDLGSGVWISVPTAYTLTLVGEVPQGTLNTATPNGFSIKSSQVPQQGSLSQSNGTTVANLDLGLTAGVGDFVYRYNGSGFVSYELNEFSGLWEPSTPSVNVGEAFWLFRQPTSPTVWTRNFSVN
jgi:hypothetical protein